MFPSTGSKVRDDALAILAHSLMSSVATPYELAVDMEAAIHKKFPPTEKGTFPDEYYRLWGPGTRCTSTATSAGNFAA